MRASLTEAVLVLAELTLLFAACIWGFQHHALAGVALPVLVGFTWHRLLLQRVLRRPPVRWHPAR